MQFTTPTRIRSIAIAASAVLLAGAAHAQVTRNWTGASGQPTNYTNGGNWFGGQIPLGSDIAQFLNTTANNLTSSGSISAGRLSLANSTVSFVSANDMRYTGSGFAIELNNSSLFLRTNSAADSTTFTAPLVMLGEVPFQPRSSLTLDEGFGGTVSLSATSAVIVGGNSAATLAVQNGATLSTGLLQLANRAGAPEASRVVVSGTNARVDVTNVLTVAFEGSAAELSIQNRGVVTAVEAEIGRTTLSVGTVTISNTGSQLNVTNNLTVGVNGTGTLNLFTGAVVNSNTASVAGSGGNGTVNVDGVGSRWNVPNILTLGSNFGAPGRLNLTGGAQASVGILSLRTNGRIDITDSALTVGTIFTGATGTLNFNSGTVNVTNQNLSLGQTDLLPAMTIIPAGRNINITANVTIPNGAELTLSGGGFTAGSLTIGGGGRLVVTDNRTLTTSPVINAGMVVGPTGASRLTFTGTVLGQGSLTGNTRFDGAYTPGNGASPVTASLDDVLFGGMNTLNLFAGFFENQSDRLSFASLGTFGGTLQLSFVGGYTPQAGDSFDLFDGPTTGAFTTLDFPDVSTFGLMYDTSQLYTSGVLSVTGPGLPGDYNGDGTVDAADYTIWRDSLGQSGTDLAADGDGNDQIDSGDYTVWKSHFGESAGSGSGAIANTAVPEPGTLVMFLLGIPAMLCRRRAAVS